MRRVLLAVVCALGLVACTGDTGPAGQPGAKGDPGANGTNGTNGMNGNDIIISARAKHGLEISPVPVDTAGKSADEVEKIGLGSYIVNALSPCADCHNSPDAPPKFLAGGTPFPLDDQGHVVYSRNLTHTHLSEDEFVEVLRTGKDFNANGQGLIVMPWAAFRWAADSDIRAIWAYLQAIPAVSNTVPDDNKGSIFSMLPPFPYDGHFNDVPGINRLLPPEKDAMGNPVPDPDHVLRGMGIQHVTIGNVPTDAANQALFGRGAYLVNSLSACYECHDNAGGNNARFLDPTNQTNFFKVDPANFLNGGQVFGAPPNAAQFLGVVRSMSANLAGPNGFFNNAEFQTFALTITLGIHADDLNPKPLAWPMPWDKFRNMELDDLEAIFTYVKTLQQAGAVADKPVQEAARFCSGNTDCDSTASETCDTTAHECVNRDCTDDSQCYACQTCSSGHCIKPAASSTCVGGGI